MTRFPLQLMLCNSKCPHGWPVPWLWLKDFPQDDDLCVLPSLCGSAELFCCQLWQLDVFLFAIQALLSFCSVFKFSTKEHKGNLLVDLLIVGAQWYLLENSTWPGWNVLPVGALGIP